MGKPVQDYLRSQNVRHFIAYNVYHANYTERVQRTLKSKINRYMRHNRTFKYVDVLQDLVYRYNHTVHSSIKMTPANVSDKNHQSLYERIYLLIELERERMPIRYNFKKGNKVRLARSSHPFKKGYSEQWTEEVFEIKHTIPSHLPRYKVQHLLREEIKGLFYAQELTRVDVDVDTLFVIDRVVRYRTRNKTRQALVKWSGYPDKFDSCVDVKDILRYK